jgi:chromosome segregation ATPase
MRCQPPLSMAAWFLIILFLSESGFVQQAEIAILHRRLELGKEQYLQLETQYHDAQRQLAMEGQHSARKKESFQDSLDAANQTVRELQSQCKSLEELLASEQGDARRRLQEHEEVVAGLKRANKEATTRSSGLEEKLHKLELTLTSERVNTTHLREVNENLEVKLQSASEKLSATTEELEAVTVRHQKQIAELRQQLKESEAHRRALSDREGASQRELTACLRAAEDTNRLLREDLASVATEVGEECVYLCDDWLVSGVHYVALGPA